MDASKDILALRNAVLAAVTNADTRLYTTFQALRSTKDVANLWQRKGETVHAFHDRCEQTFYAHQEAGHECLGRAPLATPESRLLPVGDGQQRTQRTAG